MKIRIVKVVFVFIIIAVASMVTYVLYATGGGAVSAAALMLDDKLFSDIGLEGEQSYLDELPVDDPDPVGLGSISLLPGVEDDAADGGTVDDDTADDGAVDDDVADGSAVDADEELYDLDDDEDVDIREDDFGMDDDDVGMDDDGVGTLSGLLSESEDFELEDWMAGFDPDANFGGLGFEVETGPGVVRISVLDLEGEYIDGVAITENGLRTEVSTAGGAPCIINQIPYGERVYGVYLTYNLHIESIAITKYAKHAGAMAGADVDADAGADVDADAGADAGTDAGEGEVIGAGDLMEVTTLLYEAEDAESLPPVNITDETLYWDITFVLSQSMDIRVSYYMVSPNDRFYFIRSSMQSSANDETPENENEKEANEIEAKKYISYRINTFKNAPVRIAIYVEMPAFKNIINIRALCEGYNSFDTDTYDADTDENAGDGENFGESHGESFSESGGLGIVAYAGANMSADDSDPYPLWIIEDVYGDFILPDWTSVDRSSQLVSDDSDIGPDNNATFIRYMILTLPSAYEGAWLRFNSFTLTTDDGEEIVFVNTDKSDLTIQLVPAPRLL
ncbi:MAG: hypothetical protein FWH01_11085 [Oscillospiraceae bacterium]|nr:hypothetical protein [Oscillospiraceae bacterium]